MGEVVGAFGGRDGFEEAADGLPELLFGAGRSLPKERLELGEQLLDRVEIGAVGRKVQEESAGSGDRLAHPVDLVRGEVVEHDDVARFERRREELLDVGAEAPVRSWARRAPGAR